MKHAFIDSHSITCKEGLSRDFCELNKEHFLFYKDEAFCLISYHRCCEYGSHLSYKEEILNIISKQRKQKYETRRGYHLDRDAKKARLRGSLFNTQLDEINYIYQDNRNYNYCMTTRVDALTVDTYKIDSSYKESKDYLTRNGLEFLLNELEELYKVNRYGLSIDKVEVHKSIESVIKQINKQLKQTP